MIMPFIAKQSQSPSFHSRSRVLNGVTVSMFVFLQNLYIEIQSPAYKGIRLAFRDRISAL